MSEGKPLRVLVADDSITVRKRLIRALESDPEIAVVGEAADGEEAIAKCLALRPDVVTLDVVMPRVDGVRAAQEIMSRVPTPILIVSSDSRGDAMNTMSALAAGAVDALEKPRETETDREFDTRFLRAVRLVVRVPVITRRHAKAPPLLEPSLPEPRGATRRDVVAIGGSTGGPAAVVDLLKALPAPFPMPLLLVLHIGPAFGFAFAEWLNTMSRHPALEAAEGQSLREGHVHVCPPEQHLVIRGNKLFLNREPERHSCRPSVDVLFESVASEIGDRAIGCLLTGIGKDGAEGLRLMRSRGALTMAQDEESCAVFGMPREAILRNAAVHVASPANMAALLTSASRVGRSATLYSRASR